VLKELVYREHPLFVGFSTLTGLSLLPTAQASIAIKHAGPIPVVWGGLHPTMLPEQTLQNEFIDIVGIGEGEKTIVELAKVLREHGQKAEALANVAGIAFKNNGKVIVTVPRPFMQDLDDLYPAWDHIDVGRYFGPGKNFYAEQGFQLSDKNIGAIITSRGCPWRCGFCYNQFINKRIFRAHSPQRVIHDIQNYQERYGITAIVFEDDYFFAVKDRSLEIIRHLNLPWSSNIRTNHIAKWGDEFARELSQHKCLELRIGAESGSQRMLDVMKKDITVDQIRRAVELCVKYDIPVTVGFMLGLPGERWADVLETLNLMDELERMGEHVKTLGPGIYMPYPGTPLFDLAREYGFVPPSSLEEWSRSYWGPKQRLSSYQDSRIQFIIHYKTLISRRPPERLIFSIPMNILKYIARLRWKHKFFRFPFDYLLPVFGLSMLTKLGLADLSGKLRKTVRET
jgi:anaerobic magnesium-protoporphyrin IX monomethyl ester cyclase